MRESKQPFFLGVEVVMYRLLLNAYFIQKRVTFLRRKQIQRWSVIVQILQWQHLSIPNAQFHSSSSMQSLHAAFKWWSTGILLIVEHWKTSESCGGRSFTSQPLVKIKCSNFRASSSCRTFEPSKNIKNAVKHGGSTMEAMKSMIHCSAVSHFFKSAVTHWLENRQSHTLLVYWATVLEVASDKLT